MMRPRQAGRTTSRVETARPARAGGDSRDTPARSRHLPLQLPVDQASRLVDAAVCLSQTESMENLPGRVLEGLRGLISFELGGCHVVHRDRRTIAACYQPERPFVPVNHRDFWRLTAAHPLNSLLLANPARAFMLSDVISMRAFADTELYHQLYRPLRVNRELTAVVPAQPGDAEFLLISLHRRGNEFSEQDRTLFNLLLPHIDRARERLLRAPAASAANSVSDIPGIRDESNFFEWTRTATTWQLTRRESDVLFWLSQGKTNAEIGCILGMAERTAETHALRLYPKIGVENRYSAIAMLGRLPLFIVPWPTRVA